MLIPPVRKRLAVVLVRARNPQNIGAAARAMHDFGFSDLRLVNPYEVPLEAARSAIDAADVLAGARSFATVAEAVQDCTLVLGTTAVGERRLEHAVETLDVAGARVGAALGDVDGAEEARVALLFGSEKTGLSNDELSHCHALVTIPMAVHEGVRHPSMNLGQAVAVCLYELVRGTPLERRVRAEVAATAGETERVLGLFAEVLERTGYLRHHPAKTAEADLRRLVLRAARNREDVAVWMGVLRQVLWKVGQVEGGAD